MVRGPHNNVVAGQSYLEGVTAPSMPVIVRLWGAACKVRPVWGFTAPGSSGVCEPCNPWGGGKVQCSFHHSPLLGFYLLVTQWQWMTGVCAHISLFCNMAMFERMKKERFYGVFAYAVWSPS